MMLRAKFSKLKPLRYISHLELMDTIRRALRRAQFPLAYTEGYNPHIKLSLCQPLSVGMIGLGEFFDLELDSYIEPEFFSSSLNMQVPEGIKIIEAREIGDNLKSLQAIINSAVFTINMEYNDKVDEASLIKDFMARDSIEIIRHRRKKKDRKIDLRPMIFDLKLKERNIWSFTLSVGSSGNVRPTEIIQALHKWNQSIKEVPIINITREAMYVKIKDNYFEPWEKKLSGDE